MKELLLKELEFRLANNIYTLDKAWLELIEKLTFREVNRGEMCKLLGEYTCDNLAIIGSTCYYDAHIASQTLTVQLYAVFKEILNIWTMFDGDKEKERIEFSATLIWRWRNLDGECVYQPAPEYMLECLSQQGVTFVYDWRKEGMKNRLESITTEKYKELVAYLSNGGEYPAIQNEQERYTQAIKEILDIKDYNQLIQPNITASKMRRTTWHLLDSCILAPEVVSENDAYALVMVQSVKGYTLREKKIVVCLYDKEKKTFVSKKTKGARELYTAYETMVAMRG